MSSGPSTVPNPTGKPRLVILEPDRRAGWDRWTSPNVVRIPSRYAGRNVRFGIGYVGPAGQCRRGHGGPVLPGPYAYLIPLPVVIAGGGNTAAESARLRSAGLEFDAGDGDELCIGGERFGVQDDHRAIPSRYPRLVHIAPPTEPPSATTVGNAADTAECPTHGRQEVTGTGSYAGFSWLVLACGCTELDASHDPDAAP